MEQQLSPISSVRFRQGRYAEEKILTMIAEYEESGFSVADYCQLNELSEATFYSWLKRFRNQPTTPEFTAVTIPAGLDEPPVLMEYRGIKFYQWMDPEELKKLIS